MIKTLYYKNKRVTYHVQGQGQPVLLIHGFGEDGDIWKYQAEVLEKSFLLIIPDLPGSGFSAYNEVFETIEDFAGCMAAILFHENIKHTIVLGHSMGGYIMLALKEKYADLVQAFGLVHSTAFADSEEKKEIRRKGINAIAEYGGYAFLKTTIPNLFDITFKRQFPERVNELIERGNNFPDKALQQYYRAMMLRKERKAILQDSEAPVLFVMGTGDAAVPMQDVLQQVSLPGAAFIHILENTGHMGMWESTEKLNVILTDYLNTVAAYA